jgi:hypothetical protein
MKYIICFPSGYYPINSHRAQHARFGTVEKEPLTA